MPRRRGGAGAGAGNGGGRRPGARRDGDTRDGGGRDQDNRRGNGNGPAGRGASKQKKTQEELDAEMEDYFGGGKAPAHEATEPANGDSGTVTVPAEDIDMIE